MISQACSCGFFASVVLCTGNVVATAQSTSTRPLEIYFIDVEGGAATLALSHARSREVDPD